MHLAKKMIEDRSRDYMNARRVAKVRRESMAVQPGGAVEAKRIHNGWLNRCSPGIRDRDEGLGQERPLGASTELPAGGAAGGNVEEVHPVGEKQPTAHGRPDPHHQERSVSGWGQQRGSLTWGHQQVSSCDRLFCRPPLGGGGLPSSLRL